MVQRAQKSKNKDFIAHQDDFAEIYKFIPLAGELSLSNELGLSIETDIDKIKNVIMPHLQRALELFPNDSYYLTTAGYMYSKLGQSEQAMESWRKAWDNLDLKSELKLIKQIKAEPFGKIQHDICDLPVRILIEAVQSAKSEEEFFKLYHQIIEKFNNTQELSEEERKAVEYGRDQLIDKMIYRMQLLFSYDSDKTRPFMLSLFNLLKQGRINQNPNFLTHQDNFVKIFSNDSIRYLGLTLEELEQNRLDIAPKP